MTQQEFENLLRSFLRHEPFRPFVVEFHDGRQLVVNQRSLAFGGGAATYVTSDGELVLFDCEEVIEIRQAIHEMSS